MQQKQEDNSSAELRRKIIVLSAKVLVLLLSLYILLFRIYGIVRVDTNAMSPKISGGDTVFIFHLNQDYQSGDVIVYRHGDKQYVGRVVAKAGDTVDYSDGRFTVNGNSEDIISYGDSLLPSNSSVGYPYIVSSNQVFVMGDNRSDTDDSRSFGAINFSDIEGTIIGLFRSHGI